jgi:hypothetical protein
MKLKFYNEDVMRFAISVGIDHLEFPLNAHLFKEIYITDVPIIETKFRGEPYLKVKDFIRSTNLDFSKPEIKKIMSQSKSLGLAYSMPPDINNTLHDLFTHWQDLFNILITFYGVKN